MAESGPFTHREVLADNEADSSGRFDAVRRRLGLIVAPSLFVLLWWIRFPSLSPEAHRLAAILSCVIALWVTEALPIPVTALIGATLCVILRVAPVKEVFAPFADPLMFLFIGSFILARAIFHHRLDRRLAFGVLSIRWVGASPGRMLFAFGAVTTFLSAWIANTAVTAMMLPIGLSILTFLSDNERQGGTPIARRYAIGLMLMTSFGASVGGIATPVGTAPNLIGLRYFREELGIEFPFFKWTLIGVPIVIVLFLYLVLYLHLLCSAGTRQIEGSRALLEREKSKIGPWTTGQISTLIAFSVTVLLWIVPGVVAVVAGIQSGLYRAVNDVLPESVAAMVGALLLFLLPGDGGKRVLTWEEAVKIDWGVILLFGGGIALGTLSFQTKLIDVLGRSLTSWIPFEGSFGLLVASVVVAAVVSEATSNTASATMIIPVAISVAKTAGYDPLEPALGATLGSSLGFMLPVSTPCNAIVYGSGYIPLGRMIRYGFLLDIVGIVVIVAMIRILLPIVR